MDKLLGNIKIEIQRSTVTFNARNYMLDIIKGVLKPAFIEMLNCVSDHIKTELFAIDVPNDEKNGVESTRRDPEGWKDPIAAVLIETAKKLMRVEEQEFITEFNLSSAEKYLQVRANVIAFGNCVDGIPQVGPHGRPTWDSDITEQTPSTYPGMDSHDVMKSWIHSSGTDFITNAFKKAKPKVHDILEKAGDEIVEIDLSAYIDSQL